MHVFGCTLQKSMWLATHAVPLTQSSRKTRACSSCSVRPAVHVAALPALNLVSKQLQERELQSVQRKPKDESLHFSLFKGQMQVCLVSCGAKPAVRFLEIYLKNNFKNSLHFEGEIIILSWRPHVPPKIREQLQAYWSFSTSLICGRIRGWKNPISFSLFINIRPSTT